MHSVAPSIITSTSCWIVVLLSRSRDYHSWVRQFDCGYLYMAPLSVHVEVLLCTDADMQQMYILEPCGRVQALLHCVHDVSQCLMQRQVQSSDINSIDGALIT